MAQKRNPGAQALQKVQLFEIVILFAFSFFHLFVSIFLFAFEPSGPPYHCYQMFCCLTQGVNKFILRVTVSTNKMDVLANSVLRQIVWTIADIKMHADSTLRALKLAVLLFTGTHQL